MRKIMSLLMSISGIIVIIFGTSIRTDITEIQALIIGLLMFVQADSFRIQSMLEEMKGK